MQSEFNVRWLLMRDIAAVMEIESLSFPDPWTNKDLTDHLRCRGVLGMTLHNHRSDVVGYMIYELTESNAIELLNFAVHPGWRRIGAGTRMIGALQSVLSPTRTRLEALIAETNLPAQLFFRARGFRAIEIIRRPYGGLDLDGYLMRYSHPRPPVGLPGKNRISKHLAT